jgi:uncharacterized membrane protein YjjP (DUF1212 family)
MNDKDRDLIQHILTAAGRAGEQGFSYLVHWQIADAVSGILGWGIVLAAGVFGMKLVFQWKPQQDDHPAMKFAAVLLVGLLLLLPLTGFVNSIRDLIAPEGAVLAHLLGRC